MNEKAFFIFSQRLQKNGCIFYTFYLVPRTSATFFLFRGRFCNEYFLGFFRGCGIYISFCKLKDHFFTYIWHFSLFVSPAPPFILRVPYYYF